MFPICLTLTACPTAAFSLILFSVHISSTFGPKFAPSPPVSGRQGLSGRTDHMAQVCRWQEQKPNLADADLSLKSCTGPSQWYHLKSISSNREEGCAIKWSLNKVDFTGWIIHHNHRTHHKPAAWYRWIIWVMQLQTGQPGVQTSAMTLWCS